MLSSEWLHRQFNQTRSLLRPKWRVEWSTDRRKGYIRVDTYPSHLVVYDKGYLRVFQTNAFWLD